jgi:hypothetical protein
MRNNNNLFGIAVGIVGLAYGLYSQYKMTKVAYKLDLSIDKLATDYEVVDIPQNIVDTAMKQAVEQEVSAIAHKAALSASVEITANIRKEVKQEVANRFEDISEQVSNEISVQVSHIDTSALSAKVTKKAEERILEKFDGQLDGVLDNYNKELKNVGRIYSSIAEVMTKHDEPKALYFK